MPVYEIEAPNGKILEIEGDTPPTEQELDEIFQSTNTNTEQPQRLSGGVGIDVTPSGLLKNTANIATSAITAPLYALKNKTSLKEGFEESKRVGEEFEKQHPAPIRDFLTDTVGYGALSFIPGLAPVGIAKNAALGAKVGNFLLNSARLGAIPGIAEGLKNRGAEGIIGGGLTGTGTAAAVQGGINAIPYVGRPIGAGIQKVINNPNIQNNLSKTWEVLTSVPKKFSKRALEKELAGESILKGNFDEETAYRPIEKKIREAKSTLPTNEDFAEDYYNLGQKAKEGLEKIKNDAAEQINNMLGNLNPEPIKIDGLRNAINTVIKDFGKGATNNPAEMRAAKELNLVREMLGEEGTKIQPLALHNAKEVLYDMANYEAEGGIRNDVLKRTANQIKNFLRNKYPEYKAPNDKYALIKKIEYELGGINSNTIGGKLAKYGSEANLLSGLDRRLNKVNDILNKEDQFISPVKNLVKAQKRANEIKSTVGRQYERKPKLLANRNDELFEQAIEDLQNQTGIKFIDELNDIRAHDALSKLLPGQGGGSGSDQGMGNLVRAGLAGSGLTAGAILKKPWIVPGLALMSPKMARGTIKNLGKLNEAAKKLQNMEEISPLVKSLLTPILIKANQ